MIYIVQGPKKFVKIGCTDNVQNRLKQLQTGNALLLKLLAILPGSYQSEQLIHELFGSLKTSANNEWFRYTDKLKDFVQAIQYNTDVTDIRELYKRSLALHLKRKSRRLGSDHKLSKQILKYEAA